MSSDLRYALRMLFKSPGFSLVAILTLTLGVGANTAIFSVVNGVLLRPLPYPDAGSIVHVWSTTPEALRDNQSAADFLDLQQENRTLLKIAGYREEPITIAVSGRDPVGIRGAMVTRDYFAVFAVQAIAGRTFDAADANATGPQVVLNETAWAEHMSRDPAAVGLQIRVNGVAHTVVGIVPRSFDYPARSRIWILSSKPVPTPPVDVAGDLLANRDLRYFLAVARVKPGVTRAQAEADLSTVAQDLAQRFPETHLRRGFALQPLQEGIVGGVQRVILLLLGAVGVVLLIACANIASLLLARASARQREFAVRAALGAARGRLVRQSLIESLVLGAAGGAFGILVGGWAIALLKTVLPANTPRADQIGLDATVLTTAMAIALVSAVLFGIVPAFQLSGTNASVVLREGDRGTAGGRRRARMRAALVVGEIALTLVLLVTAGLLGNSFIRLQRVELGFDADRVTLVGMALPRGRYPDGARQAAFYQTVLDSLATRADIQAAAVVFPSPLNASQASGTFIVEGRDPARTDQAFASFASVSPDYFRTLGIPLLAGRTFTDRDRGAPTRVVIVNATFARRYWPGEDAVGKRLRGEDTNEWTTVVGVVGDSRNLRLDRAPSPMMYVPMYQLPLPFMAIVARSEGGTTAVASAVRDAIRSIDPDLPVGTIRPLRDVVTASVAEPRFRTIVIVSFAVMALALAAVGVYGLISYAVSLRTREIGIRIALGAQPRQILLPVVREGLMLALGGIGIGAIGSLAATRLLAGLLFEVGTYDPATFFVAALVLLATGVIASYVPSRRTLSVDPLTALRAE